MTIRANYTGYNLATEKSLYLPCSQFVSQLSCRLNFNLKQRGNPSTASTSTTTAAATTSTSTRRRRAHGGRWSVGVRRTPLVGTSFGARRGERNGVGPSHGPLHWGSLVEHRALVGSGWRGSEITPHRPPEVSGPVAGVQGPGPGRGREEAYSWWGFRERVDALLLQLLHLLLILHTGLGILSQHLEGGGTRSGQRQSPPNPGAHHL